MKRQIFLATVALALSGAAVAQQCPPEHQTITKPGYYGAVNPEAYDHMTSALDAKDDVKLAALVKERAVMQIPAGKPACIVAIDFLGYRRRVALPGFAVPYWVADEALTEVR